MARSGKINPKRLARAATKAKGRSHSWRPLRDRILIVGAETEGRYVRGKELTLTKGVVTIRVMLSQKDPVQAVLYASEEVARRSGTRKAYTHAYTLIDKDDFAQIAEALAMGRRLGIDVLLSNECFELWALLHFQEVQAALARAVIFHKLTKHLKLKGSYEASKGMVNLFERLCALGSESEAMRRARALATSQMKGQPFPANPFTDVYRLIEHLNRFREEP